MTQESSTILALPYIQPAQAQKHVTHNEAIRRLDLLVQATVAGPPLAAPPADPFEGDRHLVAADASGDWSGHDHAIALRETGTWIFTTPLPGWQVRDETGTAWVFDGTAWGAEVRSGGGGGGEPVGSPDMLGVNATADETNRLVVSADATLLTHAGGSHQVKVNKTGSATTASLLFQTDFQGRAEMGTAGSDDFAVKVSADGSAWNTGLTLEAATGTASFPAGVRVPNRCDMGGRWYCTTDNRWGTCHTSYGISSENWSQGAGTGAEPSISRGHAGLLVPAGARLGSLLGSLRRNNGQVAAIDLRFFFQYGPWGAGWLDGSTTTREVVWSADDLPLTSGIDRLKVDLAGYEAPEDGFFCVFYRPKGTLSGTRYIYTSLTLTYTTPG